MILRRLMPGSVWTWLILVLGGGILVSQVFSAAFHAISRDEAVAALEDLRAAERIAAATFLLDHTSPVLRVPAADSISGSSLLVSAQADSIVKESEPPDARAKRLRDVIGQRLHGVNWRQIRVGYASDPSRAEGFWPDWIPTPWSDDEQDRSGRLLSLQGRGRNFLVSIQLADETWLNYGFASLETLPLVSWTWIFVLTTGLAVILLIGLAAIRLVVRPLENLAVAAEKLGHGEKIEPLPESGLAEVRRAAGAFNEMQARIRRMIEDRTQMIAAISHDLRTPITRLRLRAEFVEDPEEQQKMLSDLDQMEGIIRSTLTFAREDSDAEPRTRIDVGDLLKDICARHQRAGFVPSSESTVITGRPIALRRCLENLIDNAERYGEEALIGCVADDKTITITIDDRGPGIPEDRMEDVFRPFIRLEESRNRDSGGAGLGLAITRSIILAHGGMITLYNRKSGGLRVTVTLPRS